MLYIVATPIGNLEDITLRAVRVLKEVDLILCEDTRKAGFLLKRLGLKKPLVSFFEHNEVKKIPQVIAELEKGNKIALISSAGTPTISDPGYKLVRECRKNGLPVTALPGPASIICALCLTSLPHDKFAFLGYLPKKKNERKRILKKAKDANLTCVFFESPFRLTRALKDCLAILGNQKAAVARELTKKFETVVELPLEELLAYFEQKKPRGEVILIINSGQTPNQGLPRISS